MLVKIAGLPNGWALNFFLEAADYDNGDDVPDQDLAWHWPYALCTFLFTVFRLHADDDCGNGGMAEAAAY